MSNFEEILNLIGGLEAGARVQYFTPSEGKSAAEGVDAWIVCELVKAANTKQTQESITTQDIVIFQKLSQIVPTLGITENIIATPSGVYPDIVLLKDAKRYSDMGDYDKKTEILRNMMTKRPMDWTVDSHQPHTVGLTHRTGFKFHMPRKNVIDLMPTADPLHGLNLDV